MSQRHPVHPAAQSTVAPPAAAPPASTQDPSPPTVPPRPRTRRVLSYRTARFVVAAILMGVIVTLPFTLSSMYDEMVSPPDGDIVRLGPAAETPAAPVYNRLHFGIVAFDELSRLATLRITGQHYCEGGTCPWVDRMLLFSLSEDERDTEGLPYSTLVVMPNETSPVNQSVQLPMRGHPIRYPFDQYELWLAVIFDRQQPNGSTATLQRGEENGGWFLTLQEKLPRLVMTDSQVIEPTRMEDVDNERMNLHYALVERLHFERPIYLRVLTVLLVLLVTAAAAYAVFMRPLQDLVVNSGALVLGVWGIRSIISPGSQSFVSAVDLSLALVILFLLGAITVRAFQFFHARVRIIARGDSSDE